MALFVAIQVGEKPLVPLYSEKKDESKSAFLSQYFLLMIPGYQKNHCVLILFFCRNI
jgi:hypothetical protein